MKTGSTGILHPTVVIQSRGAQRYRSRPWTVPDGWRCNL